MPFTIPQPDELVAGRYKIERTLGVGGMAVVLAAHDELLDKPVAVKLLSPDAPKSGTIVERFLTEARAAAKVHSPHIAKVLDVGTLGSGLPYMVMERLDGCDLEELVALEHQLAIADVVDYALQALHGLAHAHAIGIVHRDLKPANLYLAHLPDGSNVIKVLDFGVAKLTEGGKAVGAVTMEGVTVGSPMYMSPEQVRSSKNVDRRTDLWALGAVLYELLVGRPPFTGEGVGEIFAAVLETTPASLRALRPEIPVELEAAVMTCMERDLEKRFTDCAAAAIALAPFGSGRWASLVPSITQTLARKGMTTAGQAFQPIPVRVVVDSADSGPVSGGLETMEAPATSGDGRRWPWLLGAAAIAAAIVAIAAVRLTATPATAAAPPAEVSPSASAIPLLPIGTSSAQAEPAVAASVSGKARAGGRSPRPKSSRPAILDSPY